MTNKAVSDTKGFFREYHLWALLITACVLAAWIVNHRQADALPGSKIDPFSGPMVLDAPGCEITGPDGKSVKDSIQGAIQPTFPLGTRISGDCFPDGKIAKTTISK